MLRIGTPNTNKNTYTFIQMAKKDSSINLLSETLKTVERVGMKKTIDSLRGLREEDTESGIIDSILSHTCSEFRVSRTDLFHGNSQGQRTNALAICYVMLVKHLEWNQAKIKLFFDKDTSNVSRYIKRVNNLNRKNAKDLELIESFDIINEKVEEYKKSK